MAQSNLESICEVAVVKVINSILVFLFLGSLKVTLLWAAISTCVYLVVRRLFNYKHVLSERQQQISDSN